jgi:hypothetical protein
MGAYERKHNPVTNWAGTGLNQVPDTLSQPLTSFPNWDYTLLPTVSFVAPNQINNMHDGNYPLNFQLADAWVQSLLDAYIQWTMNNNSLFILTFDEGNFADRITTLFHGPMVQGGQYSDTINHYNVLRTIEDIYGLGYAGNAIMAQPILNCWNVGSGISSVSGAKQLSVYPNPANDMLYVKGLTETNVHYTLTDIAGRVVMQGELTNDVLSVSELKSGWYFLEADSKGFTCSSPVLIQK